MIWDTVKHVHRAVSRAVVNTVNRLHRQEAMDVMAADWDVLVVLDACRADYYARRTPFKGNVETRWSPGSASHEWMSASFLDRELHDTVYVTANPHVSMLDDGIFHAVEDCRDVWDDELQTVLPGKLTDLARSAAREYPQKRLIVHYMQPHAPYLGETADEIRAGTAVRGWQTDHVSDGIPEEHDRPTVWDLARNGTVSWKTVRAAYAETLDIAFKAVKSLLSDLDGRVVVTADHGELLGERLVPGGPVEWSHPEGLRTRALCEIPWQVVQDGDRRDIVSEPPVSHERERLSSDVVDDRLAALGYT